MIIGIAGYSGGGKTTFIEKLIPVLKGRGFSVMVIKHDIHGFQMDHEGKDTYRFTAAGADRVMISSELSGFAETCKKSKTLSKMLQGAADMDIVLVEGFKSEDIPRLYVMTKGNDYREPDDMDKALAVLTDDVEQFCECDKPVFSIDDVDGIAEFIFKTASVKNMPSVDAGHSFYVEYTRLDDKADDVSKERKSDLVKEDMVKKDFSHFDDEGNARMVDVGAKNITRRTATAAGSVLINRETLELIRSGGVKKGDVLTVAQIAGIMGAKRTPDLIPMCHPVIIDSADVKFRLNEEKVSVDIEATVSCSGRTGVEMEALCACSTAALTVIDMCKSVQRDMRITDIRLLHKTGGVHGEYHAEI
ncbi:MAG: cyclic pyranopterin monophosphate synthase MoaC [Eubacterium sp.]|nr:cyclic pyranopterin monophosphate synthase MoaC [Eubacterium sp.]